MEKKKNYPINQSKNTYYNPSYNAPELKNSKNNNVLESLENLRKRKELEFNMMVEVRAKANEIYLSNAKVKEITSHNNTFPHTNTTSGIPRAENIFLNNKNENFQNLYLTEPAIFSEPSNMSLKSPFNNEVLTSNETFKDQLAANILSLNSSESKKLFTDGDFTSTGKTGNYEVIQNNNYNMNSSKTYEINQFEKNSMKENETSKNNINTEECGDKDNNVYNNINNKNIHTIENYHLSNEYVHTFNNKHINEENCIDDINKYNRTQTHPEILVSDEHQYSKNNYSINHLQKLEDNNFCYSDTLRDFNPQNFNRIKGQVVEFQLNPINNTMRNFSSLNLENDENIETKISANFYDDKRLINENENKEDKLNYNNNMDFQLKSEINFSFNNNQKSENILLSKNSKDNNLIKQSTESDGNDIVEASLNDEDNFDEKSKREIKKKYLKNNSDFNRMINSLEADKFFPKVETKIFNDEVPEKNLLQSNTEYGNKVFFFNDKLNDEENINQSKEKNFDSNNLIKNFYVENKRNSHGFNFHNKINNDFNRKNLESKKDGVDTKITDSREFKQVQESVQNLKDSTYLDYVKNYEKDIELKNKLKINSICFNLVEKLEIIIENAHQRNLSYFFNEVLNNIQTRIHAIDDYIDKDYPLNKTFKCFVIKNSLFFKKVINKVKQSKKSEILNQKLSILTLKLKNKYERKYFFALKKYKQHFNQWLKHTRKELQKNLVWKCIDNWKLYINYKRIKAYLQSQKKKKCFSALKENIRISKQMDKKSKYLRFILIAKSFYKKLKIFPLKEKNKAYNNKLAYENRNNNIKRKLFNRLKDYYNDINNKKNKYNKKFDNHHKNSEYIKLKISHVTQVINSGDELKKITKNNIQIV